MEMILICCMVNMLCSINLASVPLYGITGASPSHDFEIINIFHFSSVVVPMNHDWRGREVTKRANGWGVPDP